MRMLLRKSSRKSSLRLPAFLLWVIPGLALPGHLPAQQPRTTVTVGPANADIIGTDNVAIQKAIGRVAKAGGGIVVIKAATYTLRNSVRLVSHLTLRGEGPEKTILKKAPGVRSKLSVDADYGESIATVEDTSGFAPGMGVTIVDKEQRSGWTPSIRTVVSVQGNTLRFDRFLHMDYSVADRKSTRLNSSHRCTSYAVFCL